MARYRGTAAGRAKTEATRLGNAKGGILTTCNGWDLGATCMMEPRHSGDSKNKGPDNLEVTITNGSGQGRETYGRLVVKRDDMGVFIVPTYEFVRHLDMASFTAELAKAASNHPSIFEMFASALVRNNDAARILRGRLFVDGAGVDDATA